MKKINLFIALWVFIASQCHAQCFGNEGCTDGTTTDVTSPCPTTNNFHKNTFDWTVPQIRSIDKSDYHDYAPYQNNPMGNPFYTPGSQNYISHIALGTGSDFQPSDGWELVKQDFGYYYDATANKWDGTTINSQSSVSGIHYGVINTSMAYFILYNKYTGILRIFANFPFAGQQYENIEVTLTFMEEDLHNTSSTSNWANYKPSALFTAYDTIMHPLDQPTGSRTSVSTFAKFVTDKDHFCYADFQLSYDPCICYFEQGLHVSFAGIQTGHLTLFGRYYGYNSTDPALLNIDNGAGVVFGESANQNYLSSVLKNNNYDGSDIISIEKDISNVTSDISKQFLQSGQQAAQAAVIGTMLSAVSAGAAIYAGVPHIDNAEIAGSVKDAASSTATAVNLLSTGLTQNTQTSVMLGGLAVKGTSYQSTPLNGVEFSIATPGSGRAISEDASTKPEYAPAASGGALPNAPIFDEIPGLIALKSTPSVNRFKGLPTTLSNFGPFFYFTQTVLGESYTSRPFEYQFNQNSLQILYSPYVNESTTQIYAALEIDGIPLPSTYQVLDINGNVQNVGPNFTLRSAVNMTDITGTTKAVKDSNRHYITDFVPVNCLGQVITQELFDFSGILPADQDYILGTHPLSLVNRKVTLVLQVYFEFKQNTYGKTKRTFQILKYPLNIVDVNTALSTQPQFAALQNIPTNLTLSSLPATLPANGIIFSRGTISITGDLTLPGGANPIIIRADHDIIVSPGVVIGPGITLEVKSFLPICDNFSSAAITPVSVDGTFCNGTTYQANQSSKTNSAASPTIAQSDFNINLYPNPSTNQCTVRFDMPEAADVTITLTDMMGREVTMIDHSRHDKGRSFVPFNTANYATGLYLVKFTDGTHTSVQQLAISSNY